MMHSTGDSESLPLLILRQLGLINYKDASEVGPGRYASKAHVLPCAGGGRTSQRAWLSLVPAHGQASSVVVTGDSGSTGIRGQSRRKGCQTHRGASDSPTSYVSLGARGS